MADVRTSFPIRILQSIWEASPLALVVEVDTYSDATFTSGLYAPGEFAITVNYWTLGAPEFQAERFILFNNDPTKIGVIQSVTKVISEDGKGSQMLTVTGREASHLITAFRNIFPPAGFARYSETAVVETVLKNLVKSQIGSTASTDRKDTLLNVIATSGRGGSYTLNARLTLMQEEMRKACLATEVGYSVVLNTSTLKLDFDTVHGTDRTAGQSVNPRVMFSTQFDSLKEGSIENTYDQYRNLAILAGQGEGVNRNIREVTGSGGPYTGLKRRELFIDARDMETDADLDARGAQRLVEASPRVFLEASALQYSQYIYGTDYFLGDKVTLGAYDTSWDARITAVTESVRAGEYSIDLTLDKVPPTITTQIGAGFNGQNAIMQSTEVSPYSMTEMLPYFKNSATFQNNASDASNDIDFLTCYATDTTGVFRFSTATTITKRLDASWSAGTNQGGLDTGAEATSTWYACWAIAKADGTIDYLFSLSATAPTMPTGYVYKFRVGWIYNQSTSIIRPFFQKDRLFSWSTQVQDRSIAGYGVATRITITVAAAPLTKAVIICRFLGVAGASYGWIGDVSATDTTPSATYFDFFASNAYSQSAEMEIYVSSTSTIASRTNDGGSTLGVSTKGFIDII